ncbi:hypothetical protein [Tunturiibacter gelidiferens]|uniref:Uncharacterized protein n=1 Tax=Tunturiibacter gelidiferens TaxID=3069689 RepID=A0AAU7YXI4_9BACT
MNGTGKSGFQIDQSGEANFIAGTGTTVGLSLWSLSGASSLTTVIYGGQLIAIQDNNFVLIILDGVNELQVSVANYNHETVELRDASGLVLAHFDSDAVSFTIKGKHH